MNTYVGTYLKFSEIPRVEMVENTQHCINDICVKFLHKQFHCIYCNKCGSKLETNTKIYTEKQNFYETNKKFGDSDIFYEIKCDNIATPNVVPYELKPFVLFCDEDVEYEIPNKDTSISIFKEVYKDYLEFLKQNGYKFDIKFGLVNIYNV